MNFTVKGVVDFILFATLILSLADVCLASWIIQFKDTEAKTENSSAIASDTSLNDLIVSLEILKTDYSVDVTSVTLSRNTKKSQVKDYGYPNNKNDVNTDLSKLMFDIEGRTSTSFPVALNFINTWKVLRICRSPDATRSFLDYLSNSNAHDGGVKLGLVLLLSEQRSQRWQNLVLSNLLANQSSRKWTSTAIYYVNDMNIKRHVKAIATAKSYVFFVDLPGSTTVRLLMAAYEFGLMRRFVENIWLLSISTTQEFPISSNVPNSLIFGFKVEVGDDVNQCIENAHCRLQSDKPIQVDILQLLNGPAYLSGKTWQQAGKWNRDNFTVKIAKITPLLPKLRVVTGNSYPPYISIVPSGKNIHCGRNGIKGYRYENSTSNKTIDICGYGRDVDYIQYFERELGFLTELYVARDGSWGTTGARGDVIAGKADMLISSYETNDLEFSISHQEGMSIAYLQKSGIVSMGPDAPFTRNVWLLLLGTFLTTAFILWLLEIFSPYGDMQKKKRSFDDSDSFGVDDSLNYFGGIILCGELIKKKPQSCSGRVMAILFSCFAIGMTIRYTCNIITFLVINDEQQPITGLNDPKLLQGVKVATVKGAVISEKMSRHQTFRKLYNRLMYFNSFEDGLNSLSAGKIDFYIGDTFSLQYFSQLNGSCRIKMIPITELKFNIAVGFRKEFGWKHQIDSAIAKLMNSGPHDVIDDFYIKKHEKCTAPATFFRLNISQFSGLFICLSIGISFAVFIAAITWIFRGLQSRHDKNIELNDDGIHETSELPN